MSTTPRTDAALYPMNGVEIVWPDFARALETELSAAKAECERLRPHSLSSGEREDYHDALNELARLRAEVELLKVALTRAEACLMDIAKGAILTGENLRIWAETVSVLLPLEAEKARAAIDAAMKEGAK